jgi:uncharacterized membrane-anchored protein
MGRKFTLVALLLPLLTIGFGIVRAELFFSGARSYLFEVEGFDPRDLLRGHYLQFRLKAERATPDEVCDAAREACCVCFDASAGSLVTAVQSAPCASANARCPARLEQSYFEAPQRYYVPEARAHAYEESLRQAMQAGRAQALIAVDREGRAVVKELRVHGVRIEDAVP